MNQPDFNIPLFNKIKEQLREHPEEFDMDGIFSITNHLALSELKKIDESKTAKFTNKDDYLFYELPTSCNTVGCIAGWALYLSEPEEYIAFATKTYVDLEPDSIRLFVTTRDTGAGYRWDSIQSKAAKCLGLNENHQLPNGDIPLFLSSAWPEDLKYRYDTGITQVNTAAVAVEAIDRFVYENERFMAEALAAYVEL